MTLGGKTKKGEIFWKWCVTFCDLHKKKKERRDFLEVVRDVLCKSVEKHGNKNWLCVFRKRYSHHEVDSLGRIIWYVCVCVRGVCVCLREWTLCVSEAV